MNEMMKTSGKPAPAGAIDLATLKAKQQAAWSAGNYAVVGTTLQIVGEQLCEAMDLRSGQTLLDVAAGNGNLALAAARRWAEVTAIDYVPALLDRGRDRAKADGTSIAFRQADAEDLPFEDGSFDAVGSVFGVMFTPHHEKAAAEMLRVCRSGGRIGMANWTPDGFIGQLFKTIGSFVPPAPGTPAPAMWGTEEHIVRLFGSEAETMQTVRRNFVFRYRSPAHWLDVFRTYYGPVLKAFEGLATDRQAALERALLDLVASLNRSHDGTMVVAGDYLEIVVVRK